MTIENKVNPPYIAIKKIENLLNKISSRSYTSIDKQVLTGYGFSDGEASQALGTLTFLGIIKGDKTVNKDVFDSISVKNDDKKIEGIKNMVQKAYRELFDAFPEVADANTNDIHDEIKRVYSLSTRLASTAVPAFIYLCEKAGLRMKPETKSSPTRSRATKTSLTANHSHSQSTSGGKRVSSNQSSDSITIDFANGVIKLVLPQKVMTSPILLDAYKTLVSSITTFVNKYSTEYEHPKPLTSPLSDVK